MESADEQAVVVLAGDAARLELAAASRLVLPTGTADPATTTLRLGLERGGVTAEVAPRPAGAPFIIAASTASAEVVGTRFRFALADEGARLTVEHGAVRLSTPTDAGVLVSAGQMALASEGLASLMPANADDDAPLPTGSRVLWRADPTQNQGWRGQPVAVTDGGPAWRSVPTQPGDPWCRAELRSPVASDGWTVAPGTWLRFRYHVERFTPGTELVVHLKPADESNYAQRLTADPTAGWHQALLRVDGGFHHVERGQKALAAGERIHGAVWGAMRDAGGDASPVRFWIRDAVVFIAP